MLQKRRRESVDPIKMSSDPETAVQNTADVNDNVELERMYENVGGMVRLGSSTRSDQPSTSTPTNVDSPADELPKKIFMGSMGLASIPNGGGS